MNITIVRLIILKTPFYHKVLLETIIVENFLTFNVFRDVIS